MPDDPRVQQLLDELLESRATPEEVCSSCVELLPVVRNRWRQMCNARAELDALFPPMDEQEMSFPDASSEEMPLPEIPGYEVESVLGRGGMGIVFQAKHLRLNRIVALKMALAGAYAGPQERERFQREAEAVASLKHPNIVQIHDVGDTGDRPFFTMEFVDGGSLAQKLAGTPLPARQAAALLASLSGAVHAAHQAGIVHRDLKPANVLLTAEGTAKISDFGLARRLDGEGGITRTGAAVGTPSYMAPEQARGKANAIEPGVDVYALGAILYEMLTGRPPFRAETGAETMHQLLTQDPVPPSRLNGKVPRDLETICLKCLNKEPHNRYASAEALADDLDRFLEGKSISARPEGAVSRSIRRIRRRPALSAAIAVCSLLTLVLVGGGAWALVAKAATERTSDEDLKEMATHLRKSEWPEAKAALERARGRLGDRGSDELKRRLDQGARDYELGIKLDEISLHGGYTDEGLISFARSSQDYEKAFFDAGFGQVFDPAETVAERIAESNIANALLEALDHWAERMSDLDAPRKTWLLLVAREAVKRRAEPDPTGWRDRARDPEIRKDSKAFDKLIEETPFAEHSVALLLALAQHLRDTKKNPIPFMKKIQAAHPGDFWANLSLGHVYFDTRNFQESIRYLQAAQALRPKAEVAHTMIGNALDALDRHDDAIVEYRLAMSIDPTPRTRRYLAIALGVQGKLTESIELCRLALDHFPRDASLHATLGSALLALGRYDDETLDHLKAAVGFDEKRFDAHFALRNIYFQRGKHNEAMTSWRKAIDTAPKPEHRIWYGYAECCLFMGKVGDYRRIRPMMLNTFGSATDPNIAERTSRACLLLPASPDELKVAGALADRAVAADRKTYPAGAFPYFQFVKALAEYRSGHFEQAIAILKGEASRMAGPAPRLVLAMALFRMKQHAEARMTLALAMPVYDWRHTNVRDQDGCIAHVLRREAERMILPNLPKFLAEAYQPEDNIERLAFVGVCQDMNRSFALTRLYTEIFAADPKLREDYRVGLRTYAACAAAMAGTARSVDALIARPSEWVRLRAQARTWLRADLAAWSKALDSDPAGTREALKRRLASWQSDPDLASLREPARLSQLPPAEQEECLALWKEVAVLVSRASANK